MIQNCTNYEPKHIIAGRIEDMIERTTRKKTDTNVREEQN